MPCPEQGRGHLANLISNPQYIKSTEQAPEAEKWEVDLSKGDRWAQNSGVRCPKSILVPLDLIFSSGKIISFLDTKTRDSGYPLAPFRPFLTVCLQTIHSFTPQTLIECLLSARDIKLIKTVHRSKEFTLWWGRGIHKRRRGEVSD